MVYPKYSIYPKVSSQNVFTVCSYQIKIDPFDKNIRITETQIKHISVAISAVNQAWPDTTLSFSHGLALDSVKQVFLSLFYRWENWSQERLNNCPKPYSYQKRMPEFEPRWIWLKNSALNHCPLPSLIPGGVSQDLSVPKSCCPSRKLWRLYGNRTSGGWPDSSE